MMESMAETAGLVRDAHGQLKKEQEDFHLIERILKKENEYFLWLEQSMGERFDWPSQTLKLTQEFIV